MVFRKKLCTECATRFIHPKVLPCNGKTILYPKHFNR